MISVLLPTIRPHRVATALASIPAAAGAVPYEVVVVADWGPETRPHCRWVVRARAGVVDAVNAAYANASGTHVFLFNDESTLDPGALALLWDASQAHPDAILSPRHEPAYPFVYYGRPFYPFPFAPRRVMDAVGGLLDAAYRGFYADPDFSLRAQAAGVPIHEVPAAVLRHYNQHDDVHGEAVMQYLEADRATFRDRWDHLGAFADPC